MLKHVLSILSDERLLIQKSRIFRMVNLKVKGNLNLLLNTDAVFSHTLFLKCNDCELHNHADTMQTFDTDVWRL